MLIYSTFSGLLSLSITIFSLIGTWFSFMDNDSPVILSTDISSFTHCGHILDPGRWVDSPLLFFRPLFNMSYSFEAYKTTLLLSNFIFKSLSHNLCTCWHHFYSYVFLHYHRNPMALQLKKQMAQSRKSMTPLNFLTIFHILFLQFTNNEITRNCHHP